ncbi:Hypothetical_protein [Hexamita inflata]|uniref:Hypothetical_protein n=1 Tax=Hexamita inflata TaxID=28002 RepID=A0AA86TU68_9EUKA|nr:Hypothetical protein HINF_LOCUS16664 [Hexamita inflata]
MERFCLHYFRYVWNESLIVKTIQITQNFISFVVTLFELQMKEMIREKHGNCTLSSSLSLQIWHHNLALAIEQHIIIINYQTLPSKIFDYQTVLALTCLDLVQQSVFRNQNLLAFSHLTLYYHRQKTELYVTIFGIQYDILEPASQLTSFD